MVVGINKHTPRDVSTNVTNHTITMKDERVALQ